MKTGDSVNNSFYAHGLCLMEVGDLGCHAPNGWFCLFFGPTPASRGQEPRAAVPVQKVGRVTGDWTTVKALGESVKALIEAV